MNCELLITPSFLNDTNSSLFELPLPWLLGPFYIYIYNFVFCPRILGGKSHTLTLFALTVELQLRLLVPKGCVYAATSILRFEYTCLNLDKWFAFFVFFVCSFAFETEKWKGFISSNKKCPRSFACCTFTPSLRRESPRVLHSSLFRCGSFSHFTVISFVLLNSNRVFASLFRCSMDLYLFLEDIKGLFEGFWPFMSILVYFWLKLRWFKFCWSFWRQLMAIGGEGRDDNMALPWIN